jgi:hypothetical protein
MIDEKVHVSDYTPVWRVMPGTDLVWVFLDVRFYDIPSSIIWRIITDEEFPISERLTEDRVNGMSDKSLMLVCGSDDGDSRHGIDMKQ